MALDLYRVEGGIEIVDENAETGVRKLQGSGAPGTRTIEDTAQVGSVYQRNDNNGELYRKKTLGSGTAQWKRMADEEDILTIGFRNEKVVAATGDVAPAEGGTIDLGASPFGDDDTPFLDGADFVAGVSHIIFGVGGTPVIGLVSAIATDVLTITYIAVDVLLDNNRFVCRHYLPDSPDAQEKSALIYYTGVDIEKIGDINWDFADGINTSGSYTAASGNPIAGDDVEAMLEKIDGNVDAINTLLGIAQGGLHFGTFTGDILTDNEDAKVLFQELETALEVVQGVIGNRSSANNVTTAVTLDNLLVDDYNGAEWFVVITLVSDLTRVIAYKLNAIHDGAGVADATATDFNKVKLKMGGAFTHTVDVDVSGAGVLQEMRLRVSASAAVNVRAYRTDVTAV